MVYGLEKFGLGGTSEIIWCLINLLILFSEKLGPKNPSNFFFFFLIYFIFGCVGSSLLCVGFSLVVESGGYSSLQCAGFSLQWLLLLQSTGSRLTDFSSCGARASVVVACGLSGCGSWALERRLCSCGAQAQLLRGMWDLPGPGLKPVSPALAGRFLTTVPPGKPSNFFL